jgi:ATP-binding protein involved in chromosome partitioning
MQTYKDLPTDGGSDIVGQVTEQIDRLQKRIRSIRHTVAVMSGKGGVGKSAVTANLASALALRGCAVGVVDADINGPSIAKMMGVRGTAIDYGADGVKPAVNPLGVKVMSMDLFLTDDETPVLWDAHTQKDAFTWRGTMEVTALREFLSDTEWGLLDYLLIDLPPGTDRLPNLVDLLPTLGGTVVVTIPSGVSQLVVKKSLTMAKTLLNIPVVGVVENMAAYVCTDCGKMEDLFPSGHTEEMARQFDVPLLGKVPLDPRISISADTGATFVADYGDTPAGRVLTGVAERIQTFFENVKH